MVDARMAPTGLCGKPSNPGFRLRRRSDRVCRAPSTAEIGQVAGWPAHRRQAHVCRVARRYAWKDGMG